MTGSSVADGSGLGVIVGGGGVAVDGIAVGGAVETNVALAVGGTVTVGTSVGGIGVGGIVVGRTVAGAEVGGAGVAVAAVGRGVEEGAMVTTAVGNTVVGISVAGGLVGAPEVAMGAGLAVGAIGVLLASGFGAMAEAVAVGEVRTGVTDAPFGWAGAPGAAGGCVATAMVGTMVTFPTRVTVAIGTSVTGALAPASALAGSGPPIPWAKSKAISGSGASPSDTMSCSSASDRLGMTGMALVASARATLRRFRTRRSGEIVAWSVTWRCATTTTVICPEPMIGMEVSTKAAPREREDRAIDARKAAINSARKIAPAAPQICVVRFCIESKLPKTGDFSFSG